MQYVSLPVTVKIKLLRAEDHCTIETICKNFDSIVVVKIEKRGQPALDVPYCTSTS